MSALQSRRRGSLAVLSVALGTFTLVTNEFLPVGLLVDGEPPNQTPEVERAKANAIAEAAR